MSSSEEKTAKEILDDAIYKAICEFEKSTGQTFLSVQIAPEFEGAKPITVTVESI